MLVLHANWSNRMLHIWAETTRPGAAPDKAGRPGEAASRVQRHPFALDHESLASWLGHLSPLASHASRATLALRLPSRTSEAGPRPVPSPRIAHATGEVAHESSESTPVELRAWHVPCLAVTVSDALPLLDRLEEATEESESHLLDEVSGHEEPAGEHISCGESLRFFATAARFAESLLAGQRFVPSVTTNETGALVATWNPWLADEATEERLTALLGSMPASARCVADEFEHSGWAVLDDFLSRFVDDASRDALQRESMGEAIEDFEDRSQDQHVRWLTGLLGAERRVPGPPGGNGRRDDLLRSVRRWIGTLEDRGAGGAWRLCFSLQEPLHVGALEDLEAPGDDVVWILSLGLQSVENERIIIDAEDIWSHSAEWATFEGQRVEQPQELLLAELGRAVRLFKPLERALEHAAPTEIELGTVDAYTFLREIKPLLIEQGFGVNVPEWWDSPRSRLGARLHLGPAGDDAHGPGASSPDEVRPARLGLNTLVSYEWKIAIGDTPLTLQEFERIASRGSPLVRIGGQWVEVRPEDVRAASEFISRRPGGEIGVAEALRMAYGWEAHGAKLPIVGLDADGWVATLLGAENERQQLPQIDIPKGFQGDLRPYQQSGLSWLAFLDRFGLGPCLADDMGLGKTIQLLALLLHERETAAPGERIGPTLLIVPMSIVGNWRREANRFAPELKVHIHHGTDRAAGEDFFDAAARSDIVITTYALAHRDREELQRVGWHRVVLDEAQNIKNPGAKQTQAIRELDAPRRVALTGTPLENRLTELWSIMEFCNPGFLGSIHDFKRSFAIPIERYHDRDRASSLRGLVRPFILRRVKTDPTVISDLPEKVESKEYCRLTTEQAELYESTVKSMLSEVEAAEGIRRRGAVLATLTRLKQICNHPWLVSEKAIDDQTPPIAATRSGKCIRLLEMLDEVLASNEQALVFTQFRQMGRLLAGMLRKSLDREVLFLHGGTPQGQRDAMIERFQKADGSAPIFVLSLRAGGVGFNLTAASHVFHFDRWWNPAVENQATDRAYRIGQTKTVQVHKFIVGGTLEESVDQMIESKIALAEDVIGAGEDWLTELDTGRLREILSLRSEAFADE